MGAVAAPCPGHHHDDQHRIKFENEPSSGITESAAEALTEAEEFGDVFFLVFSDSKIKGASLRRGRILLAENTGAVFTRIKTVKSIYDPESLTTIGSNDYQ